MTENSRRGRKIARRACDLCRDRRIQVGHSFSWPSTTQRVTLLTLRLSISVPFQMNQPLLAEDACKPAYLARF